MGGSIKANLKNKATAESNQSSTVVRRYLQGILHIISFKPYNCKILSLSVRKEHAQNERQNRNQVSHSRAQASEQGIMPPWKYKGA